MAVGGVVLILIPMVLCVQTMVLPEDLSQYEETFTGTETSEEYQSNDVHGWIGVTDYNNDIFHSWVLIPPDHSAQGTKRYSFILSIHKMDITPDKEIEVEGYQKVSSHVADDPNRCLDYVQIDHHHYCGTLKEEDGPVNVVVKHVRSVRVDFRSDESITGRGFIASYEWKQE